MVDPEHGGARRASERPKELAAQLSGLVCGACGAELNDTAHPSPHKFWLTSDASLDTIDVAGPPLEPIEIECRLALTEVWLCSSCGALGVADRRYHPTAFRWFRPVDPTHPTAEWLK
jgi:hypothetical protein